MRRRKGRWEAVWAEGEPLAPSCRGDAPPPSAWLGLGLGLGYLHRLLGHAVQHAAALERRDARGAGAARQQRQHAAPWVELTHSPWVSLHTHLGSSTQRETELFI
jgi:hypothetical protein